MNGLPRDRRRPGRALLAAAATAAVLAAAACGSSGSSSPGSAGSGAGTTANALTGSGTLALTVGQPNPSAGNSDYYWALEQGIFTRLGLNVSTVTQGAVETTNLSTGQMVVGLFGTTGMFSATDSGRHMSIVFDENTGASTGAIFVKASSPYKTIMSLSGQKIASIGTNGAGYGAAASYSQDDGRITARLWSKSLIAFRNWGLSLNGSTIDLTDSKFSYGNTVDMSYWNAATPLVSSYIKKYGANG
jgi:NMT1/THI5 like